MVTQFHITPPFLSKRIGGGGLTMLEPHSPKSALWISEGGVLSTPDLPINCEGNDGVGTPGPPPLGD